MNLFQNILVQVKQIGFGLTTHFIGRAGVIMQFAEQRARRVQLILVKGIYCAIQVNFSLSFASHANSSTTQIRT
ncbi:hypothetical protein FBQ82_01395 [Anaerolineae bacterium CFX7]|nr:hypothetical protein [Anaerolineae bacterium CFX7]